MKKAQSFLIYWFPPVVWMTAIFYFSSQRHFGITNSLLVDFVFFKLLHMIEYGFLYYLIFRAINKTTHLKSRDQLSLAILIVLLYAISDEVHQHFVLTREGKIRDIMIDMVGIFIFYYSIKENFETVVKKLL